MQLIVKDVQALDAITAIWLVGIDSVTTDCQDLADTIRENDYFKRLPIHVKIQQLKVKKTNPLYKYSDPKCIRVSRCKTPTQSNSESVKKDIQ